MQKNSSADFVGSALRLVPDQAGQAGSAFFKQGLSINSTSDFSTEFTFQITYEPDPNVVRDEEDFSDGLAFVVQGTGPGFIGYDGESLGYRNGPLDQIYFYAIEFDTHYNSNTGDVSPSGNEVAITRTRRGEPHEPPVVTDVIDSVDLSAGPNPRPLLDNGELKNVRIEYGFHGDNRRLSVFLSEGPGIPTPQLVLQTILTDNLFHFGGDSTYLGFTASTGDGHAHHDIFSWTFNVPEPGALSLFGIAGLVLVAARQKGKAGSA